MLNYENMGQTEWSVKVTQYGHKKNVEGYPYHMLMKSNTCGRHKVPGTKVSHTCA